MTESQPRGRRERKPRPPVLAVAGPWSHGATEALAFARTIGSRSDDSGRRVAFLLTDNAVELGLKTYLNLAPSKRGGFAIKLEEPRFPDLLAKMAALFPEGCEGFDPQALEHYHTLRNSLYHHGNGFSPDRVQVDGYVETAVALLRSLFGDIPLDAERASYAAVPADLADVPSLAEALRSEADRARARQARFGTDAPVPLIVTSDAWELIRDAHEYVSMNLFERAADPESSEWVVNRIEHLDPFSLDEDIGVDETIEIMIELADLVEMTEI